jgi:hypothetical protein
MRLVVECYGIIIQYAKDKLISEPLKSRGPAPNNIGCN